MKSNERMSHMSGTIAQVDAPGLKLIVKGLVMNKTFDVANEASVITSAKPKATLGDLKVGDPVEVTYEQHQSGAIAHRIDQASAQSQPKAA